MTRTPTALLLCPHCCALSAAEWAVGEGDYLPAGDRVRRARGRAELVIDQQTDAVAAVDVRCPDCGRWCVEDDLVVRAVAA